MGRGPSSHRGVLRVQLLLLGEEAEAVVERDLSPGKAFLEGRGVRREFGGVRKDLGGRGGTLGGFRGVFGAVPQPYLWDGQREVTEHLEGGGAVAAGLALEAALQLPHKEIWGGQRGVSEGTPGGFGVPGRGGTPPLPALTHDLAVLPLQVALPHLVGAFVVTARGGDIGPAVPKNGVPPPQQPSPRPSPERFGVLQGRGSPCVRQDAGGAPALPVDLHVQPVHEELEEFLRVLLAAGTRGTLCARPRSPRGSPEGFLGGVSPVAREGGDVFLEHGLEAPGVDGLGGVGVPEGGNDIGKG